MVCTKCGKELPIGATFCESCGERVDSAAAGGNAGIPGMTGVPGDPDKKQLPVGLIAGVAAAVVVVLLLIFLLAGGSSPKSVLTNYYVGYYTCNFKKAWGSSIYDKAAQKALDMYDKDDYEDDYEDAKDDMDDQREDWKDDGVKYKIKVDVKKTEIIKKSDKEFEWAQEYLEDCYRDCDAKKVQQFAIVKATIKGEYYEDGDRDKDYDISIKNQEYLMVKLGGKWYYTGRSRSDFKDYLKSNYK